MSSKKYRNAIRSRNMIQEALMRLLCRKEIEDITVTELTGQADINRRTFYLHYSNLAEVLEALEAGLLERLKEQLRNEEKKAVSPEIISAHIVKLLEPMPLKQMGVSHNSPLYEVLYKVANTYIEFCMQEETGHQQKDGSFEMSLHVAVSLTISCVFRWASGLWHSEVSYQQLCEEITSACSKL